MRDSSYTLTFAFSATLDPFTPGATETDDPPATFVRASATDFTMDTWLANVLPGVGDEQDIGGTAVAGPVPIDPSNTCDIAPLLMCALEPDPEDDDGRDCSDGDCFGFNPGAERRDRALRRCQHGEVRAGKLPSLAARVIRTAQTTYESSWRAGIPGAPRSVRLPRHPTRRRSRPVIQGFNTRFGIYAGGMSSSDGAPDTVTYARPPGTNPDRNSVPALLLRRLRGAPGQRTVRLRAVPGRYRGPRTPQCWPYRSATALPEPNPTKSRWSVSAASS